MARPRSHSRAASKPTSASTRGRKRAGRDREEEEKQHEEDVEEQVEEQQDEYDEVEQRPAKRAARSRSGSTGCMDEEEEEQMLSYDVEEDLHAGVGAAGVEYEEEEDAEEEETDPLETLQSKKMIDKLFQDDRKRQAKQMRHKMQKAVESVIRSVLVAVGNYTKSTKEQNDREWAKLKALVAKAVANLEKLVGAIRDELAELGQVMDALDTDFRTLSQEFLNNLQMERQTDNGEVQRALQGLKEEMQDELHGVAEGINNLQGRMAKAVILQTAFAA